MLEVSLRPDKERVLRLRRVIGFILRLTVIAALGAGVWIGTKEGLRRFVWENPSFYLSDIHVSTDGALTHQQILSTGDIVEGRNIFLLNLKRVQTALENLPQVERADVRRTLPNRIDVEVTERQPIAWISAPGDTDPTTSERSYLIDARGFVMKCRKLMPEYLSLPIISGYDTANLVATRRVTDFEMRAALDLIRLNVDSTRWQVRNIDVSKQYCLVVTDRSQARIIFGLDNMDKQLSRFYRLLDVIEPTHREIQTANLFVERNIPVTFADAPVQESEEPVLIQANQESDVKDGETKMEHPKTESPKVESPKAQSEKTSTAKQKKSGDTSRTSKTASSTKKSKEAAKRKPVSSKESERVPPDSIRKPFRLLGNG